jgi:hypothetical protein
MCTGRYNDNESSGSTFFEKEPDSLRIGLKSKPEDFIQIYVNDRPWLAKFLEHILSSKPGEASEIIWNTLLELYLSSSVRINVQRFLVRKHNIERLL